MCARLLFCGGWGVYPFLGWVFKGPQKENHTFGGSNLKDETPKGLRSSHSQVSNSMATAASLEESRIFWAFFAKAWQPLLFVLQILIMQPFCEDRLEILILLCMAFISKLPVYGVVRVWTLRAWLRRALPPCLVAQISKPFCTSSRWDKMAVPFGLNGS